MSVTTQLSEPLVGLQYDDLPPDAVNAAKNAILDTLGCMLAGAQTEDMPAIVQQLTGDELPEQSTVIRFGKKTSVHYALLLNATMGHAVELDDVHKEAKSHAGTVVVPAALSYGEDLGVSGKELLLSVIIGYEVMLRIGSAINASEHRLKGWHATGTCGTFGAAAAIAKLEQFDLKQFVSALGLAGTQSSGLWAFTADGANCKKFHAGSAASSGYMAATLTRGGLTGPAYILEAEDGGLFRASSNHFHFDVITRDIGKKYEITRVSHKPYACCRSMHPSIQAALTLKDKGVEPESIKRVKVKTYEVAKVQCGFTSSPKNVNEARFSIPYGIAVAFYDGEALLEQFTEDRITDRKVLELAAKVEIEADETFSKVYPRKWGCQLEIETYDGQHLVEVVDDAKGDPRYPLSRLELQEKFMALAGRVIGREKAVLVMSLVDRLEKVEHIGELIELCSE